MWRRVHHLIRHTGEIDKNLARADLMTANVIISVITTWKWIHNETVREETTYFGREGEIEQINNESERVCSKQSNKMNKWRALQEENSKIRGIYKLWKWHESEVQIWNGWWCANDCKWEVICKVICKAENVFEKVRITSWLLHLWSWCMREDK